jgi:hypothetical protein
LEVKLVISSKFKLISKVSKYIIRNWGKQEEKELLEEALKFQRYLITLSFIATLGNRRQTIVSMGIDVS